MIARLAVATGIPPSVLLSEKPRMLRAMLEAVAEREGVEPTEAPWERHLADLNARSGIG